MTDVVDPDNRMAPFGYGEDGNPLMPHGAKADGTPRLRPGGRRAGETTSSRPKAPAPARSAGGTKSAKSPTIEEYRKAALGWVAFGSVPYQLLGSDPMRMVSRFIGPKQVMACKGNATIISMFSEPLADVIAQMATVNPGLAARLETGTVPIPYLTAIKTLTDLTAALIGNHANPNPELADTQDRMIAFESGQIRRQIEEMETAQREADRVQRMNESADQIQEYIGDHADAA